MNLGKKIQKIRKKFKNSKKDNRNLCVEPKLVMCTGVENVGLPHKSKATSTPSLPVSAVHCEDILHTRPRPLVSQYDSVHESVVSTSDPYPLTRIPAAFSWFKIKCWSRWCCCVLHLELLLLLPTAAAAAHHDLAQHAPVDQHVCAPCREDVEYRRGA